MEIYSRYSAVETPEGRRVELPEYLERVWEVVAREALEQVLGTAEAQARNGAAGALEEDARLTALFLWTLQSTDGTESDLGKDEENVDGMDTDDEAPRQRTTGFSMPFDVARRFAQPLGIHLEEWDNRIIQTQKGVVKLRPVTERAKELFGDAGADQHCRRNGGQLRRVGPTPPLPRRGTHGARPGPERETGNLRHGCRCRNNPGADHLGPAPRRDAAPSFRPHGGTPEPHTDRTGPRP